uniref:Uncharacterized protein n=1 Tax=Setaria italica TaxID=4555 RepID=K3XTU7_SETIT
MACTCSSRAFVRKVASNNASFFLFDYVIL